MKKYIIHKILELILYFQTGTMLCNVIQDELIVLREDVDTVLAQQLVDLDEIATVDRDDAAHGPEFALPRRDAGSRNRGRIVGSQSCRHDKIAAFLHVVLNAGLVHDKRGYILPFQTCCPPIVADDGEKHHEQDDAAKANESVQLSLHEPFVV